MCFSAQASFAASGLLTVGGFMVNRHVTSRNQRLLASLPLFFAFHQLVEGLLWLNFSDLHSQALKSWLSRVYLFYSYGLLPVIWPLSFYLIEPQKHRKRALRFFVWLGSCLAFYLIICLFFLPAGSQSVAQGIRYTLDMPFKNLVRFFYIAVTSAPCFSSDRLLVALGCATLLACLVAFASFWTAFVSVWCFFTALLSLLVYLYVRRAERLIG